MPLPHAMTSYLETDNKERHTVLESGVSLEIENGAGQIVTVHRTIKSLVDNKLISVDFGPTLTDAKTTAKRRTLRRRSWCCAASRLGFHFFLEDFLGWKLPMVRRYNSADAKLYLETIFPLFWVEQKAGWSAIPAAIPTYLRIREVHKRAIEFIMDLDVHKLELRRLQLDDLIAANAREWRTQWEEVDKLARRSGGKTEALPQKPTSILSELDGAHVMIAENTEWLPLRALLSRLRSQVAASLATPIPEVGSSAADLERQLHDLNGKIETVNTERVKLYNAKQLKSADIESLKRRIKSLAEVPKIRRRAEAAAVLGCSR